MQIELRKRREVVEIVEDVRLLLNICLMIELLYLHKLSWSKEGTLRLLHSRLKRNLRSWLGWCAVGLASFSISSLISCTAVQVHHDHIAVDVCKAPGASIEYAILRLLD